LQPGWIRFGLFAATIAALSLALRGHSIGEGGVPAGLLALLMLELLESAVAIWELRQHRLLLSKVALGLMRAMPYGTRNGVSVSFQDQEARESPTLAEHGKATCIESLACRTTTPQVTRRADNPALPLAAPGLSCI